MSNDPSLRYLLSEIKDELRENIELTEIKFQDTKYQLNTCDFSPRPDFVIDDIQKGFSLIKEKQYLFSWNDVPGSDSERLIDYLVTNLEIDWAKDAEIKKSGDGKAITITKESNSLTFKLNREERRAILEISGGEISEYLLREVEGKLKICEKPKFEIDERELHLTNIIHAELYLIKRKLSFIEKFFDQRVKGSSLQQILHEIPSEVEFFGMQKVYTAIDAVLYDYFSNIFEVSDDTKKTPIAVFDIEPSYIVHSNREDMPMAVTIPYQDMYRIRFWAILAHEIGHSKANLYSSLDKHFKGSSNLVKTEEIIIHKIPNYKRMNLNERKQIRDEIHALFSDLLRKICAVNNELETYLGKNRLDFSEVSTKQLSELIADCVGIMIGGPSYFLAYCSSLPPESTNEVPIVKGHPPKDVRISLFFLILNKLNFPDNWISFSNVFIPKRESMLFNLDPDYERYLKPEYLFSWNDVPGSDSERLIDYLVKTLEIDWAKDAEIKKSEDGKAITITKESNSLELKLNEREDRVILKTNSVKTYGYIVKKENGRLNLYKIYEELKKNFRKKNKKISDNATIFEIKDKEGKILRWRIDDKYIIVKTDRSIDVRHSLKI
jgi:hypothetical protein